MQLIILQNQFQKVNRVLLILLSTIAFHLSAQSAEQWVSRGLVLDSAGNYAEAVKCYNKALEFRPEAAVIWYNRGVCYMQLKKYGLAVVDFNKALYLDSSLVDAYFNRSLAYRYTGNYQFALSDISIYISRFPEDFNAIESRALLAIEMKDYQTAASDLELLLTSFQSNTEYALLLEDVYIQSKRYTDALNLIQDQMRRNPQYNFLYLNRAYVHYHSGNYEKSVDDVNTFLIQEPNNTEALKLKADDYFFLKRFQDASFLYQDLLQNDSVNANLLADYGHCLLQMQNYKAADSILTKSIRAKNDAPAYAYLGRGIARNNLGMGNLACEDWWKSYKLGENRAAEYLNKNCAQEKQ